MKKALGIAICLVTMASAAPKDAFARSCKGIYRAAEPQNYNLADILAKGDNPFDVARAERNKNSDLSDQILEDVTERLRTEKVVAFEALGGGVNDSYRITFESGLIAAYKPVNPNRANQPTREAVAFRLSQLLKLDMVPPTIVRKIEGPAVPSQLENVAGSVQLFITTARPLQKGTNSAGQKILMKDQAEFVIENSLSGRRLRVFDWLINNHDRGSNAGNYLVSKKDNYVIGIDHSVSFVGHDKQARADKVPFYKDEFLKDLELYQKLKAVKRKKIEKALDGLNPVRIEEFFQRYDQLMRDFERVLGVEQAAA